jgi:hypothetical protein
VANDEFNGRSPFEIAFNRLGDAALLAGEVNPELVYFRRIVAAISLVSDNAVDSGADLLLDVRDDRLERMAVVGGSRQRDRKVPGIFCLGASSRCEDGGEVAVQYCVEAFGVRPWAQFHAGDHRDDLHRLGAILAVKLPESRLLCDLRSEAAFPP